MGKTLTAKIIEAHLVEGEARKGAEVGIRIDQTLTQDATGTMAYLEFESIGIPRVKTEVSVSYVDHNTMQGDFRNMDDHRFLQSVAKKFGIYFSRPGNGICHQVHLERFGVPGKTLLGSDSHTPTGGGLGMLAIGAGGLDVAIAMGGGPFYLDYPEVVGVRLAGALRPMVSAKDIILEVLRRETVKGGVGKVYEYHGPGVASLSVTERATITNMGAELGATSSIFPADTNTRLYLERQGRAAAFRELGPDPDAAYDRLIEIDLDALEPLIACPHMPDKVVTVRSLEGTKVDQVAIGSCTNSSINDISMAARMLAGKVVDEGVSCGIAFGSRQVLMAADRLGYLGNFLAAGCRILENACGPCIGMGFAPSSGAVSLRTFNRNFEGRSGTPDAKVYLCSPETAAAAALTGKITDPRAFPVAKGDFTSSIAVDDSLIIPPAPAAEAAAVEVVRGPNIKPCPVGVPLPESIAARVVLKVGDDITTDHIMPAGSKVLPLRSNIPEIAKHVFAALDPQFHDRALAAGSGIVVGGANYGQGSSREHAALAPMHLGIKAVVVKSFARIHKANLVNFGILPLVFADPADYDAVAQGDSVRIPGVRAALAAGGGLFLEGASGKARIPLRCEVDKRGIEILLAGGMLNLTKERAR